MKPILPKRQAEVFAAFQKLTKQFGGPPTAREVGESCKPPIGRSNTWMYFTILAKKGYLIKQEGRSQGGYRLP